MPTGDVFIVDDNPNNLTLLAGILREAGFGVRAANDGRRALAMVANRPPELILLDISMPDIDGYEVCAQLKENPALHHIPVIFISALDDVFDKVKAFRAGGVDYITKPFQAEEVLARVECQLKIFRLQRELEESQRELQSRNDELARSEQRALGSERQALEANRAKSVFLSNMSHELRTPLNAVLGYAQLLDRDASLTGEQRQSIGSIQRSGEHLLGLINDVLSLSKIEAGKTTIVEAGFDLRRLLKGVEDIVRVRAHSKCLQFVMDIAPEVPQFANGDEGKLRQILINLLGNAVKFTDSGAVSLTVRWEAGRASFDVEDTGCGIAEDEIGTLFEPFVQSESGRKSSEGTGLGLAISRNFARLMDGRITVRSTVGMGTVFGVDVALARLETVEAQAPPRKAMRLEPGLGPYRILIADDIADCRCVLKSLLDSVGFETREAANGQEAVRMWAEWHPHLIWMDMRMPVMNGYEATRNIRRLESDAPGDRVAAKILALSASAFEHDREAIFAAGCDDYLTKPFREEAIFDALTEHLGARFVYREILPDPTPATGDGDATRLDAGRLARLPPQLRTALKTALVTGDVNDSIHLANQVRGHDEALAHLLKSLIQSYEFDQILEAFETDVG